MIQGDCISRNFESVDDRLRRLRKFSRSVIRPYHRDFGIANKHLLHTALRVQWPARQESHGDYNWVGYCLKADFHVSFSCLILPLSLDGAQLSSLILR